MTYQLCSETNNLSLGPQELWKCWSNRVPIAMPLFLFVFFIVVFASTYYSQRRLSGREDLPACFAAAGFSTGVLAVLFTLVDGLISLPILVLTITISIISIIVLFLNNRSV